ncbi:TolC family protein [Terracidiphilus gabretensis]|uniref:TolC family protein n=1 Tax=Terracidiphilus gabretensis TaxID=1577687 RepID=UPI00071B8A6B|nr:TolC family protein [Terracidiphilus gabretensis]
MDLHSTGVSERRQPQARLRAFALIMLILASSMSGLAQQGQQTLKDNQDIQNVKRDKEGSPLPNTPVPTLTEPLWLRPSSRDFSKPYAGLWGAPWKPYTPTTVDKANFSNSVRLTDLLKNGKIYLSLSDAIALTLENNYDIAISRYYLDIADLDFARAKAGGLLHGVGAAVLQNTIGGSSTTLSTSGAPGTVSGAAAGSAGIVITSDGAGPAPTNRDPIVAGTIELQRAESPSTGILVPRAFTNTDQYNFTYTQGFSPGTQLQVTWNNSRTTTNSEFNSYSPQLYSTFLATVTQPLLQGAGTWINNRLIYEAKINRRITDSTFRQQILQTVNTVENIYWVVVSAYEDVQAKQRALDQSSKVLGDTQKQLDIGTMAPLDVVNAQSTVATDKQSLINSQVNLNYQQLVLKQAIARNLGDPALVAAPIIPTDRVSLAELPEEGMTPEDLVQEAFKNRPELEQAALSIKKDEIALRGARNALLPTLNLEAFYGAAAAGGAQSPYCENFFTGAPCGPNTVPQVGYPDVLNGLVNSSSPNKGVEFTFSVPLRNRTAQADQARSLIEYRQAEMHLEQLYTQIHMQVVAQKYALTNDRAQVMAAQAASDYAKQSLDAEQKKLSLGASTTTNVLQYERNVASAENTLINANLTYAKDRALLYQTLATTLEHYNINLSEAATGQIGAAPVIPGLEPPKQGGSAPQ